MMQQCLVRLSDLVFISGSTSQLNLTGTLNVPGNQCQLAQHDSNGSKNVVNISSTGSTKFGDTSDDIHDQFTGSVNILGNLSSSVNISASAFYGDGSKLSNVTTNPAAPIPKFNLIILMLWRIQQPNFCQ